MKPKVYILQDNPYSPRNFTPAEQYGDLVFCFKSHISAPNVQRYAENLDEILSKATVHDWIIPVGNPALIMVAGQILSKHLSIMRLLIWDKSQSRYIPICIPAI